MLRQLMRTHLRRTVNSLPRLPKPLHPREPLGAIREYLADLLAMQAYAWGLVQAALPSLEGQLRRAASVRGDGLRMDDAPADIHAEINTVKIAFARRYTQAEAEMIARKMAARGKLFTAEEVRAQFRHVLGFDPVTSSPAVEQIANAAVIDNVALIQSIPSVFFGDIEREVMTTLRTGSSTESLRETLEDRYDVSRSRATLIARDQVSKLNGNLTKTTHEQLGITSYTWRTSKDERVRETHRVLEGQKFSYDAPPQVGNPGEDYQCRCTAEPDFEELQNSEG